jgi:hypothetical protein
VPFCIRIVNGLYLAVYDLSFISTLLFYLSGNTNIAVLTFAVQFRQLPKVVF